jgi:hypothetical protein
LWPPLLRGSVIAETSNHRGAATESRPYMGYFFAEVMAAIGLSSASNTRPGRMPR